MLLILLIFHNIFQSTTSFTLNIKYDRKTILQATKEESNKRLLDVLVQGNPELQHIHMPFIEPLGNSFIDCKMVFGININDIPYIIATPHDSCVAICYTKDDTSNKYVFLQPEDEEMNEIFPIASEELSKLCPDLKLKNTPRTLTVSGDLKKYLDSAWNLKKTHHANTQKVNDDDDKSAINTIDPMLQSIFEELSKEATEEDEEYFQETMKKALGDKYIAPGDDIPEELLAALDPKILELIESTSLNVDVENLPEEELTSLLKEMFQENFNPVLEGDHDDGIPTMESLRQEAVAEKLLSFKCDDKIYSLVHLLEPTVIIGRDDPMPEFRDSRKLLVTPEEMEYVLPQIKDLCLGEFDKYGIEPLSSP